MKNKLAISTFLLLLITLCAATEWLYPFNYRSDISGDDACYTNYLLHRPDTTCKGSFYPCCDETVLTMAAWTCFDFVDSVRYIDTVVAIVVDSTGYVFDTLVDTSYIVMDTTICMPLPTGWDSLVGIVVSCTLYIDTASIIVMYDTVVSIDTMWVVSTYSGGLSFTRYNTWQCDTYIVPTTPPDTCIQCDSVMHIDWYRMSAGSYLARHIDLWDIPIYSEGTCGVTPSSGGTYISIDIDTCNGFQACAHISYARYGYFYVDYGDSVVFKSCLGDTVKIPSGGGRRDTLWIGTIPPPTHPIDTTTYAYGYWVSTCDGALDTVTTAGDTIPFLSLSSDWSCAVYAAAMWSGRYPSPSPPRVEQAAVNCTDDVAPEMISAWLFEHIQGAGLWTDSVLIGGNKKHIYECFMFDYGVDPFDTAGIWHSCGPGTPIAIPDIWHSRHVPAVDGYPCRPPHDDETRCQLFHNIQREPYGFDVSFETATNCDSILFDIVFDPQTMSYIPDGIIDALAAGVSGYKVICFIAGMSKVKSVVVNGHTQVINFDYYDHYTSDTTFYEVEIPVSWWNWRGLNKVKIGISSYAADACRWIGANALFAVATPTGTTTITRARTWTPIGSELVIPECDTCRTICLHNEWLGAITGVWAYEDTVETTLCISTCSETLDIRDLFPYPSQTTSKLQSIEFLDTTASETTYVASVGNAIYVESVTGQELNINMPTKIMQSLGFVASSPTEDICFDFPHATDTFSLCWQANGYFTGGFSSRAGVGTFPYLFECRYDSSYNFFSDIAINLDFQKLYISIYDTSETELLVVNTATSAVGIKTPLPAYPLDVAGAIHCDSLFIDTIKINSNMATIIAALAAILDSVTTSDGDSVVYGWKFGRSSILFDWRTH